MIIEESWVEEIETNLLPTAPPSSQTMCIMGTVLDDSNGSSIVKYLMLRLKLMSYFITLSSDNLLSETYKKS